MRSNGVELHTRPSRHWNSSTVYHEQVSLVNSQSNVPRENGQNIAVVSVCGVTLVVEYPQSYSLSFVIQENIELCLSVGFHHQFIRFIHIIYNIIT